MLMPAKTNSDPCSETIRSWEQSVWPQLEVTVCLHDMLQVRGNWR